MLSKYFVDQIPPPSSPSPCLPLRNDKAHQLTKFNQMKNICLAPFTLCITWRLCGVEEPEVLQSLAQCAQPGH